MTAHSRRNLTKGGGTVTQIGAICWRLRKGKPRVCLITSRETRRWVVPKGWPMRNRSDRAAAAIEAFEEAGLEGRIAREPLGTFDYDKILGGGRIRCRVTVYGMRVNRVHSRWPEARERTRKWFSPKKAASMVAEPELARLLRVRLGRAG